MAIGSFWGCFIRFKAELNSYSKKVLKNYYQILGVGRHSSKKEITKRTYALGKILHPRKLKAKTHKLPVSFEEIIEAYYVLQDHENRQTYDWLFDHHLGKKKLREESVVHLEKELNEMIAWSGNIARNYSKQPFWIFRDDLKSTSWWNLASLFSP